MRGLGILMLGLLLAGCGSEPAAEQPSAVKAGAGEQKATVDLTSKERGCPFMKTTGWYAQIENSRFLVDGQVDFLMAGYKPALTKRAAGGGGALALDLSLAAAPGGAVEPAVHYEEPLGTAYGQVVIYCGGEPMTTIEPMDQRL